MFDFTSDFWSWFIIVLVIGSFVFILALIRWMSEKPRPESEARPTGHVWDEDLQELNNPMPQWWLMLFYITIVFGAIYLVLYPGLGKFPGLLGVTQITEYENEVKKMEQSLKPLYDKYQKLTIADLSRDPVAMKTAGRLFANYCTVCHGSDARGSTGFPNLRDTEWLYGGSADNIKASITNGRQGIMPAWKNALGKEGLKDVTEYILGLNGRRVDVEAQRRGQQKFAMCAGCHGADARGNPALGAPDLTNNIWLHGGSKKAVMATIADGRQSTMPAHKEFLGESKVHLLAAYVYGLSEELE